MLFESISHAVLVVVIWCLNVSGSIFNAQHGESFGSHADENPDDYDFI